MTSNETIQQMADEITSIHIDNKTLHHFAEAELRQMNISHTALSLLGDKDGVSVWRINSKNNSYIMKCFEKAEYRREITNYRMLISLEIPTLKVIANTDCSIVLEDIEQSSYRLGTADDLNNPQTAALIAAWYKKLHNNGRMYAADHTLYDECDHLIFENISRIKEQTKTSDFQVWTVIEDNFDMIKMIAMQQERTLTYNDFYYTNFAVAKDGSSALMFDYNLLGKSYVYADIRNVCSSLGEEAQAAFLSAYGSYNEKEKDVDDIVCALVTLHFACEREKFPSWAASYLEEIKDGRLLTAINKLLGVDNER